MPAPLAHLSFATLWQPIIMVQSAVVQILYLLIVSRIGKRFFPPLSADGGGTYHQFSGRDVGVLFRIWQPV